MAFFLGVVSKVGKKHHGCMSWSITGDISELYIGVKVIKSLYCILLLFR